MSAEQGVLVEGGEERPPVQPPVGDRAGGKPRLKPINREQICLQVVDVERLVEQDHPVRAIWELVGGLNLSEFYEGIKAVEGVAGRDRSDPRLLISLWLYAVSQGVRAARELAEWSRYDPGCQWLTGLGRINYHTLSDFVTVKEAALEQLFLEVLEVLLVEDLVELKRVMHDGTKVRACASRRSFKREERLAECRKLAEEQLTALKRSPPEGGARARKARQRAARERRERVDRAEQELKRLQAHKGASEQAQVRVSVTDPEARVMKQGDGGFAPSYNVQISTDARHGALVAFEVSQAGEDSQELRPALERMEHHLGRLPEQMVVDGNYTTRQNILETAEQPTELIGSLGQDRSRNKLERHGVSPAFFPEHFLWDAASNSYTCPAGKPLRYKRNKKLVGATEQHYRAKPSDCQACPHHSQCCPKTAARGRLLIRIEEHPTVAAFRQKMQTPHYRSIYRERAPVAEFSNACLKEKKGLRRFLRRGRPRVRAETAWACISCNVSLWIRLRWKARRRASA